MRTLGLPFTGNAAGLGRPLVKNIVAVAALQAATDLFPAASFLAVLRQALKEKCSLIPLNEEAFAWGRVAALEPDKKEAP